MNFKNLLKTLGPGILFASTAIGVSHLVQSTRAGANYGFQLIWIILLTNLFKYPFFEYGSRFANATGSSIIDGYKKLGNWVLWVYFLITIGSMFFVTAAVGAVTAGFMDNLFDLGSLINFKLFPVILVFVICISILLIGKYNILDHIIKIIGSVLLLSTLTAFILTLIHGKTVPIVGFEIPKLWNTTGIAFTIALMGWMPTALDLSAWNSLWTLERIKQTGYHPTLKETLLDFNFGYILSVLLAICFVTLGAYLMYGTQETMPNGSAAFANTVINLYTKSIGSWSTLIIAASAFSIMFGTAIAVFDGYARSLKRSTELLFLKTDVESKTMYNFSIIILGIGSFLIIYFFGKSLKQLVDLATTISFLIAPLVAIANFKLVQEKYVGAKATPPKWLKILSWTGILFLSGFSLLFVIYKFIIN